MSEEAEKADPVQFSKLVQLTQDLGYKALPLKSDAVPTSISTSMSGFSAVIFHYPGHSIQMYSGFKQKEGMQFTEGRANEFNSEYRFAKCYVTETGIRFEGDFFFDVDSEGAAQALKEIFDSWEITLGFASGEFRKLEEASAPAASNAD